MPLSTDNERRIRKNYKQIVAEIQQNALLSFIDDMYGEYCLTGEDKERINAATTTSDKVRIFLDRLITGPAKGYAKFIELLKNDESYTDLAKQIEETDITEEDTEPDNVASWIGVDDLTEKANKQFKDVDLLNFSKAISPNNLCSVGTRLGLDQVTVQNIEYKYNRAPAAASQELLFTWRNKLGNKATVRQLLEKLFDEFKADPKSVQREAIIKALQDMK